LKSEKSVGVSLEVEGGTLALLGSAKQTLKVPTNGDKRVDWRVKVTGEGQAVVRVKAVSDEDADAMQLSFPCFVPGMLPIPSSPHARSRGTPAPDCPAPTRPGQPSL